MLAEQEVWALALSTFAGLSTTLGAVIAVRMAGRECARNGTVHGLAVCAVRLGVGQLSRAQSSPVYPACQDPPGLACPLPGGPPLFTL